MTNILFPNILFSTTLTKAELDKEDPELDKVDPQINNPDQSFYVYSIRVCKSMLIQRENFSKLN